MCVSVWPRTPDWDHWLRSPGWAHLAEITRLRSSSLSEIICLHISATDVYQTKESNSWLKVKVLVEVCQRLKHTGFDLVCPHCDHPWSLLCLESCVSRVNHNVFQSVLATELLLVQLLEVRILNIRVRRWPSGLSNIWSVIRWFLHNELIEVQHMVANSTGRILSMLPHPVP